MGPGYRSFGPWRGVYAVSIRFGDAPAIRIPTHRILIVIA